MGGQAVHALVDTGCSKAVVRTRLVDHYEGETCMTAFDGRRVKCRGATWIDLVVGGSPLKAYAIVLDNIVNDIDLVLGMDIINRLGGVSVSGTTVQFGKDHCLTASVSVDECTVGLDETKLVSCRIEDRDFEGEFDGKHWTVRWFWKNDQPPTLRNKISCYDRNMNEEKKGEYEKEIERWIEEGILLPWKEEVEDGVLSLMAVEQPTKNKVRPVLDYRELNMQVECHTGDDVTDVCTEKLREWRQMNGELVLVDLRSAYLQIRVAEHLWKYQLVKYQGRTYCLTRLGFGLSAAPRIMAKILKTVLAKSREVEAATSSYVDDILLNESLLSAEKLIAHLNKFGLATKPPERLDGGAALGLRLERGRSGELVFSRGNILPVLPKSLTRRELFSVCGKLVGHYPVAGWLRVACSYIKRKAEGISWNDNVGEYAMSMIKEVMDQVKSADPVRGRWSVNKTTCGSVWCDASSIAIGVLLEIGGEAVEDASWLRKKCDYNHINVAELEAILKGVNLALKWDLREITVITDSSTVYGWVNATLTEEKKIRTKGAAEMIVKRRLGTLKNLIDEFDLKIKIVYVPTSKNKADGLTRVRKGWLTVEKDTHCEESVTMCAESVGVVNVEEMHNMHHVGVDRTLFLVRKVDPNISRRSVQEVVRNCVKCQSVDPAPVVHEKGNIGTEDNWKRLAIDVTHYRNGLYLTMVDCGPGRYTMWKELARETAECIVKVLNEVFLERGPVDELMMDNSTAFRSELLKGFLEKWNIQQFFRAAYKPSGNGIVERNHRTIKAIAERGNISPLEAVFWYNMSPRTGQREDSVPQKALFNYDWRHPVMPPPSVRSIEASTFKLGDEVWVKPPFVKCTSHWKKGTVTGVNSNSNVSVDGMPRHVLDLRRVVIPPPYANEDVSEQDQHDDDVGQLISIEEQEVNRRYPQRDRQPPRWMGDYVIEEND